jgi:acid phosphatase type 7
VLKLTLHASSYDWEFVPEAGKSFKDSGTGTCH